MLIEATQNNGLVYVINTTLHRNSKVVLDICYVPSVGTAFYHVGMNMRRCRVTLRCVALRCVALRCVALRCVALRCVALRCVALRCVALRCVALRCVALRYVTLRSFTCKYIQNVNGNSLDIQHVSGGVFDCDYNSPCTAANRALGRYFFRHQDETKFVQCDAFGACLVRPCAPGTVFDNQAFVCAFPRN